MNRRPHPALPIAARLLTVALALLAGCAAPGPTVADAVGPLSGHPLSRRATAGEGYLEVRTRTDTINSAGTLYHRYTPYSIYTPEGRRVLGVMNRAGDTDQKPMTVPLPAGRYVVYALPEGAGRVGIPIVILRGQLTPVNLEYRGMQLPPDVPAEAAVRLSDGRIIGRRAAPAPAASP